MLKFTTFFLSLFCVASEAFSKMDVGAIWVIGDSITQGNADGDPKGSYRSALYDLLKDGGVSFSFTGHHVRNQEGLPKSGTKPSDNFYHYHSGLSGFLIGEDSPSRHGVYQHLDHYWETGRLADVKPKNVLIMLGTNDVDRGYEVDSAPARLKAFIDKIYRLSDESELKVFVGTIPPNGRIDGGEAKVMLYNEGLGKVVDGFQDAGKRIYLVDHFTPLNQEYDRTMLADDLHVNAEGNKVIAEQWYEAIKAAYQEESGSASGAMFPGKKSKFHGYDMYSFKIDDVPMKVICPKVAKQGKPWLQRGLFWIYIRKIWSADLQLVDQGYHIVVVQGDVHGHPSGNKNIDIAYDYVTENHGFSRKCSMASISRGNLAMFRWASANPEKVESLYVDNGVSNALSWPAGKKVSGNQSVGQGAPDSWVSFKEVFGYKSDQDALESLKRENAPIHLLKPLAAAKVPILLVCGTNDHVVPYEENDKILKERYLKLGGEVQELFHNDKHSHGLSDPTEIIQFISKHTDN